MNFSKIGTKKDINSGKAVFDFQFYKLDEAGEDYGDLPLLEMHFAFVEGLFADEDEAPPSSPSPPAPLPAAAEKPA